MSKHTERTLRYLRKEGYTVGMVERFNRFAGPHGQRIDLFNFIDAIAIGNNQIVGVQSCGSNFAEHDRKILAEPRALEWLEAGGKILLIGWRKIKQSKTSRRMIYKPRIKWYTIEDFNA